ncbi:MAG: zinc ribbon domain-containing protein [Acidobacteriota bacterium]|nr:zinc ribbon domain-containing protein [Acidobacteriota bacterium]
MFCPACGQRQISEETRFCSRCGFLLTGVTQLIANGGAFPPPQALTSPGAKKMTPRRKGLRKGGKLFMSGILIVPLLGIITMGILDMPGYFVGIAALITFLGGLLRMIYALLFESNDLYEMTLEEEARGAAQNLLGRNKSAAALPPQQTVPASTYVPPTAGNWRDTNDLSATPSVTENTTKFLDEK